MAQDFLTSGLAGVPSCAIVMWSGLVSDIPDGWSICDGTNGTPDLREKFVRGTAGTVGSTGGCGEHCHILCGCLGCPIGGCGAYVTVASGCEYIVASYSHTHELDLSLESGANIPPYYELIFIRKD